MNIQRKAEKEKRIYKKNADTDQLFATCHQKNYKAYETLRNSESDFSILPDFESFREPISP